MPIMLPSESTTGAPLIPRSDSSAAKLWTVVSGSTVITLGVITSIARIAYLPIVMFDRRSPRSGAGKRLSLAPGYDDTEGWLARL